VVNPDRKVIAFAGLTFYPVELILPDDVLVGLVEEEQCDFLLSGRGIAFSRIVDGHKVKILDEAAHRGEAGSGGDQDELVDGREPRGSKVSGVVAH